MSAEVNGPGSMYDSTPSLPSGKGLAHFGYKAREYFVSGVANKQPYKTRIVVRKPTDNARFSGLVLAEAMHPSAPPTCSNSPPLHDELRSRRR